MKINILFLIFSVLIVGTLCQDDDDAPATEKPKVGTKKPVTKLQIGVKKRVDCEHRSKKGDSLSMHYTGTLHADGTEFDSSLKRGDPLEFVLGSGQVIKGWDQGLMGMCAGEKRKLVIPPDLAYGASGAPPTIPANSALVFEVELIAIKEKKEEL